MAAVQAEAQELRSAAERQLREEHGTLAGASELSMRLQRALDEAAAEKERLQAELCARLAEETGARAPTCADMRASAQAQ